MQSKKKLLFDSDKKILIKFCKFRQAVLHMMECKKVLEELI